MSLIHWWPLTTDLKDKCGGSDMQCSVASFVAGKIGKCIQIAGGDAQVPNPFIGMENWSIAFWFRDDGSGDWKDFICWSDNKARLEIYKTAGQWIWYSNSTTSGSVFPSGTNISSTIQTNVWYHIAIVKEGTKAYLYINGNVDSPKISTSAVTFTSASTTLHFNSRADTSYGAMSLNDVRCYNHALSKKEIKELSKALVLHYTFDNSSFESTTNLLSDGVTNFSNSPLGTYSGFNNQMGTNSLIEVRDFQNKRCLYLRGGSGSNNRCYIYKDVAGSTKYTFSCDIYSTSQITLRAEGNGGGYGSGWPQVGATTYTTTGKWQRVSYTMDVAASPRLYLFFVIPSGVECYINNLQLEEKDHDTLYTPATRTGVISDGSGLGNDGTLHLPQYYKYSHDSIIGTGGLHCTGETSSGPMHIDTKFNPSFINGTGTVCVWYKKDAVALSSDYNYGNFIMATPDRSKESGWLCATSAGNAATNVNNCSYTTWYYDGAARKESNEKDTKWHFYCATGVNISKWTTFQIHSHGDKSWLYRGTIADYRVYNTILSADDVKELYESRWAANGQGQVFSNAINEDQSKFQVTRSGITNCNELYETPTLPPQYTPYESADTNTAVDTGIIPDQNTCIDILFTPTSYGSSQSFIYGGGGSDYQTRAYELYTWSGHFQFNYNNSTVNIDPLAPAPSMTRVIQNKNNIRITQNNTTVTATLTASNFTADVPLTFGAINRTTGTILSQSQVFFHRIIIRNGEQLQRYYVPCFDGNQGGFYDFVTGTFTGNGEASCVNGNAPEDNMGINSIGSLYCAEFNEI